MNRFNEPTSDIQKKNIKVCKKENGVDWLKYEWLVKLRLLQKQVDEKTDVINKSVISVDNISIKNITVKMLFE